MLLAVTDLLPFASFGTLWNDYQFVELLLFLVHMFAVFFLVKLNSTCAEVPRPLFPLSVRTYGTLSPRNPQAMKVTKRPGFDGFLEKMFRRK